MAINDMPAQIGPVHERPMGLFAATGVGVGAIVGGGILALAGVAFAASGPGAMVAFACNGVIAIITALSFAELATQFPESGGTYSFAKKVLSIEAAFTVGWVVWFASIVAGVLYAFGFGVFAAIALEPLWRMAFGEAPVWFTGRLPVIGLGVAGIVFYAFGLLKKSGGGGEWVNIGKVFAFAILIGGGLWVMVGTSPPNLKEHLTPFFSGGASGLIRAMGFTFIALQGFDLIAAVAGEIRNPERTIPRAMLSSLGIALAIYLPLLLVIATVGMENGVFIADASAERPEAIVALAAANYLGGFGYWVVIIAAILSMLSALHANLFAASRIALAMARDRTMPHGLEILSARHGTPVRAILVTAAIMVSVLLLVPDVSVVGAAASLVFLVTFALAQRICIMARRRSGSEQKSFRVPWFPMLPWFGAVACAGLAVFQGIVVPLAGLIVCIWLALGGILYSTSFARRARNVDASSRAQDANLARLSGRNPLVLVPIANPATAEAMVGVANALAPPTVGRVLLLSVVAPIGQREEEGRADVLSNAQVVLGQALNASFARGLAPEVLITIAGEPWPEIGRVARLHRCETLLVGLSNLSAPNVNRHLENLMATAGSDVVVLRAPAGWLLRDVRRVLIPVAGRGDHDELRARLLGSIHRSANRETTFLRVMPPDARDTDCRRAERELTNLSRDLLRSTSKIVVARSPSILEELARHAQENDLVVLGVQRPTGRQKVFGNVALQLARETSTAILMLGRR